MSPVPNSAHPYAEHVNARLFSLWKALGMAVDYARAQGPYLWDGDGQRYLDLNGGYGVFTLGRNHPMLCERLTEFLGQQAPSLVKLGVSKLAAEVAAALKQNVTIPIESVHFGSTGAEAVEMALSFAQLATQREGFVYCENSYHGLSANARSVSDDKTFCPDAWTPSPAERRAIPFDDLEALELALAQRDVAAFIVEPIQGKTLHVPQDGYLTEAGRLCRRHGTLLIVDEIQSGMGRTGRFLATEWEPNATPDLVTLSKALGGGLAPVSAVLAGPGVGNRVFQSFERAAAAYSTFSENALAMTAALGTLEITREEGLCEHALRNGHRLGDLLQGLCARYPLAGRARGRGMMRGLELDAQTQGRVHAALGAALDPGLFAQGVLIPLFRDHQILAQVAAPRSKLIKFLPPLNLSAEDFDWTERGLNDALKQASRFPGPLWRSLLGLAGATVGGATR